jgi:hypothetical protein
MFLACQRTSSSRCLPHQFVAGTLLVALLVSTSHLNAAEPEQRDIDHLAVASLIEQINSLRAELEDQQSTMGVYDPGLLSSLNQLGEALISAGALSEAQTAVEQQLQIIRINDGLYSSAQVALIQQQLAILAAQGNWPAMQDRLQYLTWLFERTDGLSISEKLHGLKTARDWARLLLTRGPREQEAMYLLQLRTLEQAALALAHESNADVETLQAYTYDQAIAELYIALGIIATTDTSRLLINRMENIQTTPLRPGQRISSVSDLEAIYGARTSTVIERSHRTAMNRHYQLINSLADLMATNDADLPPLEETDPEAAAMLQLYLGDSILLRTQYELRIGTHTGPARGSASTGIAARYYKRAWELFLEAGHDEDALNLAFACPVLLPLQEFSTQLNLESRSCHPTDHDHIVLPDTFALRNGVPGIRHSGLPENAIIPPAEGVSTTLKFNIGVNGQAERIEILAAEPDAVTSRIRGRDSLIALQFRPALQDGRSVRTLDVEMTIYSLDAN